MKLEYDKDVDAAYIYLVDDLNDGQVTKTIELNENIILDFDNKGKLLGMEILNASKVLNEKMLLKSSLL
jgi:uncharacterized protein YuzE